MYSRFLCIFLLGLFHHESTAEGCDASPKELCSEMRSMRAKQTMMMHQMKAMRHKMTQMMRKMEKMQFNAFGSDSLTYVQDLPEKQSLLLLKTIVYLQKRVDQLEAKKQNLDHINRIEGSTHVKRGTDSEKTFIKRPSSGSAFEGEYFEMECQTNTPVTTCIWISPEAFNIYPQPDGKSYRLIGEAQEDGGCTLRIMKVRKDHEGVWTCNPDVGSTHSLTATAELKVQEKPEYLSFLLDKIEKTTQQTEACQQSILELDETITNLSQQFTNQCMSKIQKLQQRTEMNITNLRTEFQKSDQKLNDSLQRTEMNITDLRARFHKSDQKLNDSLQRAERSITELRAEFQKADQKLNDNLQRTDMNITVLRTESRVSVQELNDSLKRTQTNITDLRTESELADVKLNGSLQYIEEEATGNIDELEKELKEVAADLNNASLHIDGQIKQMRVDLKQKFKRKHRLHDRHYLWYDLERFRSNGYKCSPSAEAFDSWRCHRLYYHTLLTYDATRAHCRREGAALFSGTSEQVVALLSNITGMHVWVEKKDYTCNIDSSRRCSVMNLRDQRKSCVDCERRFGVLCVADVRPVPFKKWRRFQRHRQRQKKKKRRGKDPGESSPARRDAVGSLATT